MPSTFSETNHSPLSLLPFHVRGLIIFGAVMESSQPACSPGIRGRQRDVTCRRWRGMARIAASRFPAYSQVVRCSLRWSMFAGPSEVGRGEGKVGKVGKIGKVGEGRGR